MFNIMKLLGELQPKGYNKLEIEGASLSLLENKIYNHDDEQSQ